MGPAATCANATLWMCRGGKSAGLNCRDTDCEQLGGACVPLVLPSASKGMQVRWGWGVQGWVLRVED